MGSTVHVVGAVVAAAMFVYLVIALLKPEWLG